MGRKRLRAFALVQRDMRIHLRHRARRLRQPGRIGERQKGVSANPVALHHVTVEMSNAQQILRARIAPPGCGSIALKATGVAWRSYPGDRNIAAPTTFSWRDGTPTATASKVQCGLFTNGKAADDGFAAVVQLAAAVGGKAAEASAFHTTPFFAAIIGWLWLREPVKAKTWAAMAACILGVGIMVSGSLGTSLLIGDGLAFVVVLIFATAVVAIRRYPQVDLIAAVWLSSILSAVVILPFSTPFGHAPLDYGLMAFFGAVEYVVALLLFTSGARLIPAAQSTLIGLLEVVLSPIWVWLAINEVPGRPTLIGGALILVTLVLYTLDDWARPKAGGGREADVR